MIVTFTPCDIRCHKISGDPPPLTVGTFFFLLWFSCSQTPITFDYEQFCSLSGFSEPQFNQILEELRDNGFLFINSFGKELRS
jgi:hypothetical protein